MRYDKLVRDKIPEMIQAKGEKASYHVADATEYWEKLKEKLLEEATEFKGSEGMEEMADVFEVIYAIMAVKGWNIEEIVRLQREKREQRGGFEKKIILDEA